MVEETLTLMTKDHNYYDKYTVIMVKDVRMGGLLDCAVYISRFECNIVQHLCLGMQLSAYHMWINFVGRASNYEHGVISRPGLW